MTSEDYCKYSPLYKEADTSFLINFGSKNLRPIRISLPKPPPYHLIDGFGLHPDDQKFKRLVVPQKLVVLQKNILTEFRNSPKSNYGTNIINAFWEELEAHRDSYADEILFIKRYIWFRTYGYWVFIDGKPTYLPPMYFSYLNEHMMTLEKGYGYPEYRIKGLYRFLFREYLMKTTETFADIDKKTNVAYKVAGEDGIKRYRMVDTGRTLFVGVIEPKGRREGLTNEACHMITRISTVSRGADKLATIVSMDGDNAGTHYMQKLVPAWKSWPIWIKPAWEGQEKSGKITFSSSDPNIEALDCRIDYTDSAGDMANDGKMMVAALFDEQGKGKRTGNVQERWQVNKQAMTLSAGKKIVGFSFHPSTVEKMTEGGADYKSMCDSSNFYERGVDGQTRSGLAVMFFPSDWCMEDFIDAWGNPVLDMPTPRQIQAGFKERIGSQTSVRNRRKFLHDETDPAKMEELKSFIRKCPIEYDECWTGVSGLLGLDNEKLRTRITQLQNKTRSKTGEFRWIVKHRSARFEESPNGKWIISEEPVFGEANRISSMEDYSPLEDDMIMVNRPADPHFIAGVDPAHFTGGTDAQLLVSRKTKLSDTAIAIIKKRDKTIDVSEDPRTWKTRKIVAFMKGRMSSSEEAADELLKACIFYGALAHIERNVTVVWQEMIKLRFGGFLNYEMDVAADGEMRRAPKPGTKLDGFNKKEGFDLLRNFITFHSEIQEIKEWMEEADEISSMEQLTKFDGLAAVIQALFGDQSPYIDILNKTFGDHEEVISLGATSYRY